MSKKTYFAKGDMIIEEGFFRGDTKKKTVKSPKKKTVNKDTTKKR